MPDSISLTVAAASSLADVFPKIGTAFTNQSKGRFTVRFQFAASGAIEAQIRAGAPIDVFAAAGEKEMGELVQEKAIRVDTRTIFAANRLVLIQPTKSHVPLRDWRDLMAFPANAHLVIGKPDTVPAGRFAKEVLTKRGVWNALQGKRQLVFAGSVRQVLESAIAGNADAAVVFATDARSAGNRVRVVATAIPGRDHAPIRYVVAVPMSAVHAEAAQAFTKFLIGNVARKMFAEAGFAAP